jgi:hypothetical protein
MGIDDGAAYREADPDTTGFGRVKGFENALELTGSDPGPGIGYRYDQPIPLARFRDDLQFPLCNVRTRHCFDGIEDEVEHDLLELNPVSFNRR